MNFIKQAGLKDGLSGIIRAKNEEKFIEPCIKTCVDALDELIIVYNDCTDRTPEIVESMCKLYPDKVKGMRIIIMYYRIICQRRSLNMQKTCPMIHRNCIAINVIMRCLR